MADPRIHQLFRELYGGRIDRRQFVGRAAALGVSATAISYFLRASGVAAQDASPTPIPADQAAPVVVEPCAGDDCPFAGQTVTVHSIEASIAVPVEEVRAEFEQATGATLELIRIPFGESFPKLLDDMVNETGQFDTSIAGAWWLGELVEGDFIVPLEEYRADPQYPEWDLDAVLPGPRALMEYGGQLYMTAYDHDGMVFYYRRDLLTDPEHQAAFRDEAGYDLPVPPQTWDEAIAIAQYFNGKDLDGDGEPDSGITMHLRVGIFGFFHYMSYSAPFVIGPDNPTGYWFNPEDMTPLIASAGHEQALESMMDLAQYGPEAMYGWSLGECWNYFLEGKAALCFTWGDLGALAQETPERGGISTVKGRTATAQLPGTTEYYDPVAGAAIASDAPNIVGNTNGGSWAPVLSRFSQSPQATYYLMALLADTAKSKIFAARGFDGVDPGATFHFPPPNGTGDIADYVAAGWDEVDAAEYVDAYFKTFSNQLQQPYLRIPGTYEYWTQLDVRLSEAVTGQSSAADALAAVAADWEEITDRLGRDLQLQSYRASLGLE